MAWCLSATSSHWGACETADGAEFGSLSCWGAERQGDPRGACLKCQDPWFCLDHLCALGQSLTPSGLSVHFLPKILPGRFVSEIFLGSDVPWINLEV